MATRDHQVHDGDPVAAAPRPTEAALDAALEAALRERFGLAEFRPGQREAAAAVLRGRDVVAVMPTGAGKSLCFQLPSLLLGGPTVVVSPLIALMKDQVDRLRAREIAAAALHSGMTPGERSDVEDALASGRLALLYVAPERLGSTALRAALARARPARLVIDEAHCISQWGHDFRPDYRRLAAFRRELGVPAAAFTATATPDVRADIVAQLGLRDPFELVTGFERPNLTLSVETCRGREEKLAALRQLLADPGPPGIVYAATRKAAEEWAGLLASEGVRVACYHAGLEDAERARAQDDFHAGRVEVVVATNAFGMGIDKHDLRFVAHAGLPGSIEAYYQEAGRAGRAGRPSRCALLFGPADIRTQEFFLAGSNPAPDVFRWVWRLLGQGADDEEIERHAGRDAAASLGAATAARLLRRSAEAEGMPLGHGDPPVDFAAQATKARRDRERLDTMVRYAFSRGCRTRFIFDYFAGAARGGTAPRCGTCDVCLGWRRAAARALDDEELLRVRIALSAVGRLSGRFGVERIAQVLVGSESSEVLARGLDRVPTYGRLAGLGLDEVKDLLGALADAGLVERQGIEGGRPGAFVLSLTAEGRSVAKGERRPELALPPARAPAAGRARRRRPTAEGAGPGAADVPVPQPDPELLARLRAWRAEEARRKGVPAYVVFHDSTLAALAAAPPRDLPALGLVKGVGPAKLAAYGEALLRLLG